MPQHEYTPKVALKLLLERLRAQSPELVARIQSAIDAGKEILESVEELSGSGRVRKRKRKFWKTIAYTDAEALSVVMIQIQAHLVESREMLNEAFKEFKEVGISPPKPIRDPSEFSFPGGFFDESEIAASLGERGATKLPVENVGEEKSLSIESEPERLQEKRETPDVVLTVTPQLKLLELGDILNILGMLTDFEGGRDGYTR